MADESARARLGVYRRHRRVAVVVAVLSLIPCLIWLTVFWRWLTYDGSRAASEQPLFGSLGLMNVLLDYLGVFLVALGVLILAVAWALRAQLRLREHGVPDHPDHGVWGRTGKGEAGRVRLKE